MNRSFLRLALRVFLPFGIAIALALSLRSFVTFYSVPSSSMEPTLFPGETIVVRRYLGHQAGTPRRNDVVVFCLPQNENRFYVKRIVAIAGDYVEIVRGELRVNGSPVDEPYLTWRDHATVAAQIVPAEMVFVLGDRRNGSLDSRVWGPIPSRFVVGTAVRVFWSFDRQRGKFSQHRVRLERIGRRIR